ncbi:MAG: glycosyltransferase [Bacteroidales bacterium]|nr:glycosyltransferase [Bacteroidales bacterium]
MFELPSVNALHQVPPFVVFIFFSLAWLIQMIYYWALYSRLSFYKDKARDSELKPVSVIICAKNEYQNLLNNLPLILEQDHPDYEVIVVNDASDDDSVELLQSLSKKYHHLRIFDLERNLNFFSGKKFPLSLGIKSARHDIILLTDADCRPASAQWIRKMQARYDDNTEIVLGYGAYQRTVGLLNQLIRYDAFLVAMQYLSYALAGIPYMGVGRNLSYKRELFYHAKGFTSHYKLKSGDDDLFIHHVAQKANTRIEISTGSHTVSKAKSSFIHWVIQKRRHYTTAQYYRPVFKVLLSLAYISKLLLYLSFIVLMILKYHWLIVMIAFAVFFLSHWVLLALTANKLKERDLAVLSPVLEIFLLALIPVIYFSNLLIKQERWK